MDQFSKIRLVGRGAHGTVYLCSQKSNAKHVILKEIPVDQMTLEERQTSMNEAKVLAMLDHPNVISYFDSFLDDKTMVIVMEYVQGGTLFDYLKQRCGKLMSEGEILCFFGQMVYTLQYVHEKLILHRDLKSQNILLNESQTVVKIGDFGISKVLSTKSKAYTVVGTPCYISPELCEGKAYNQKSDIWALGCILYECMTLKRPFEAETLPALIMRIMKGCFDPVDTGYSRGLQQLLSSMLHLDSNQRPSAAGIMCHPVMMRVIFHLYASIGSFPCNSKSSVAERLCEEVQCGEDRVILEPDVPTKVTDTSTPISKAIQKIWLFDELSDDASLLALPTTTIIKYVSMGTQHIVGITNEGLLIRWINESLEKEVSSIPFIIDAAVKIVQVACGDGFTVCLSDSGVVHTFGNASSGCLGYNSEKDVKQPKIVKSLFGHSITAVACGPRHVLAIEESHEIFAWGYNSQGCSGLNEISFQLLPTKVCIPPAAKPAKIFCGKECSWMITTDFSVLVCGSNRHNKLALNLDEGHQIDRVSTFTPLLHEPFCHLKLISISIGNSHTLFLDESGKVYSAGSNSSYQLGWGEPGVDYCMAHRIEALKDVSICQIYCGSHFSMALSKESNLCCWGKLPKALEGDEKFSPVGTPLFFVNKSVKNVSCNAKTCIILGKE